MGGLKCDKAACFADFSVILFPSFNKTAKVNLVVEKVSSKIEVSKLYSVSL